VTTEANRRPPGRPRRYAPGRINLTLRVTPQRHEDLKASAIANGRSISEEIEVRVERSFTGDLLEEIRRGLDAVASENAEIRKELEQSPKHAMSDNPKKLSPLDLERVAAKPEIERLTGMNFHSIKRHYANKIVRLSPRRIGMRIKDVLSIAVPRDSLPPTAEPSNRKRNA
jgi:hypothetical protein